MNQKLHECSPFRRYFGFFSKKDSIGFFSKEDNIKCLLPTATAPFGGSRGRNSGLLPSSERTMLQAGESLRGLRKKERTSAWAESVDVRHRAVLPNSSPITYIISRVEQLQSVPFRIQWFSWWKQFNGGDSDGNKLGLFLIIHLWKPSLTHADGWIINLTGIRVHREDRYGLIWAYNKCSFSQHPPTIRSEDWKIPRESTFRPI